MKRIRAHVLLFASLTCFASAVAVAKTPRSAAAKPARAAKVQVAPSLPDRNPLRVTTPAAPLAEPAQNAAPTQAAAQDAPPAPETSTASDATLETGTVATPSPNQAATPADALPLPDRNPSSSVAMTPSGAAPVPTVTPQTDVAKATSVVPLPEHNPQAPALLAIPPVAPAPSASPPPQVVTDMPPPDPNPNRTTALPFAMKGTLAPAIAPPPPAMDYAAILKPILSYDLSASDDANIREVLRSGTSAAAKIKDPAARDFALWYKYRNSPAISGNAEDIEQFRLAHPDWPAQDELREKAETVLFLTDAGPDEVRAFFKNSAPLTGAGKAALASVDIKDGDEAGAKALVVSAWRDHQLNAAVEKKILDRYGNMLTADTHRARIDRLLYPDDKKATEAALRVSKLLPADEQKKVAARIAVVQRGGNAGKLLNALPASAVEADVGLRFNRIQWLRRTKDKDRREEAWKMLLDAPSEPNILLDLNNWWTERRINCRGALNDGHPRVAYDIAAKHGLVSGDAYIEAEFLAGWISLRFLGEPHTAMSHFTSLRAAATSSKSIALGEYWLGRTSLALGDRATAIVHFHGAAKYPQYFYGQLGRQSLDARPAHLEVTPTPLPKEARHPRLPVSRYRARYRGCARLWTGRRHAAIPARAVAQAHQSG